MRRILAAALLVSLVAVGVFAALQWRQEDLDHPNIIFILADDIGITGISCYGGDQFATPHIDALARDGVRFNICCSMPVCGPSRATLLTGQYPFRTGAVDNPSSCYVDLKDRHCFPRVLRDAGYVTGIAGKWRQLPAFANREESREWGFDEYLTWEIEKGDRYRNFQGLAPFNLNGEQWLGSHQFGPDVLQQYAVNFVKRHQDRPFFLYYSMVSIHEPLRPTPLSKGPQPNLLADNIAYMDKLVGDFVASVDKLGLRRKTIIIFAGDNGLHGRVGTLGGRPIDGKKADLREGGCRVPLIVSWKGTAPQGLVCDDLVDFSDFYPTLSELAAAPVHDQQIRDGRSFAARIKGQSAQPREWLYVHYEASGFVRDHHWKLYRDGRLCDMTEAPFQETLVAPESQSAEAAAARVRLQAALDTLR